MVIERINVPNIKPFFLMMGGISIGNVDFSYIHDLHPKYGPF